MPWRRIRSAPPSIACSASASRTVPVARDNCSKRGPPINAPSSCSSSTRFASGNSAPFSHGGTADREVDLDARPARSGSPSGRCPAIWLRRSCSRRERRRAASASAGTARPARTTTVRRRARAACRRRRAGRATLPGANTLKTRPSAVRDVHLDVVGVPLVGDRLDADARACRPRRRRPRSTRSPTRASPGRRAARRTRTPGRRPCRRSDRHSLGLPMVDFLVRREQGIEPGAVRGVERAERLALRRSPEDVVRPSTPRVAGAACRSSCWRAWGDRRRPARTTGPTWARGRVGRRGTRRRLRRRTRAPPRSSRATITRSPTGSSGTA